MEKNQDNLNYNHQQPMGYGDSGATIRRINKIEEHNEESEEKRKESEKVTEDILEGANEVASVQKDVSSAQQEVKDMMSKMKLIEDDIKGAAVDEAL